MVQDVNTDFDALRVVANYQFGRGVGSLLFPMEESPSIKRSRTGRPRQVIAANGRIVSVTTRGRLTLGIEGGWRLEDANFDSYVVQVTEECDPYLREGRNAFAKFVTDADPEIRPGDEVRVRSDSGHLLAVGRATLSASGMLDFESGVAVNVRDGAKNNGVSPDS